MPGNDAETPQKEPRPPVFLKPPADVVDSEEAMEAWLDEVMLHFHGTTGRSQA